MISGYFILRIMSLLVVAYGIWLLHDEVYNGRYVDEHPDGWDEIDEEVWS